MAVEIRRTGDAIQVRSPAPRIDLQIVVVLSWVPFIAAAGAATYATTTSFSAMAAKGTGGMIGGVFFVVFSVFVLVGCVGGALSALYGLLGHEEIRADASGITLFQELWGMRLRQHYPPYRIRHVRVYAPTSDWGSWSPPPSHVIFDTPGRVKGFGSALTAEQAAEVAGTISDLLPDGEYET